MKQKIIQQIEFSSVLFDTLFGLILYFSLESFLEIHEMPHFMLYLFSTIILVHWWLMFKSADDMFGKDVTNSSLDIIIGIIEVILLEYVILFSRDLNIVGVLLFAIALFTVDLVWSSVWLYVGKWSTNEKDKVRSMELELTRDIKISVPAIVAFGVLLALTNWLTTPFIILFFILFYIIYIVLTFKLKIIDLTIF